MRSAAILQRTPTLRTGKYGGVFLDTTLRTIGTDSGASSTNSFNRMSGTYYFTKNFLLKQILWDIYTTQTYDCYFVSDASNSPSILYTIGTGLSLTGSSTNAGTENTITLPTDIILTPGKHFISMYCATPVRWCRLGLEKSEIDGGTAYVVDATYNGSAVSGSTPVKFSGYYITQYGLESYQSGKV